MNVSNASWSVALDAGEYRIYTDKKLEKPEIGLGEADLPEPGKFFSFIYPNPSSGNFNIVVFLTETTDLEIGIYDLGGRKVQSIGSGTFAKGEFTFTWDGYLATGIKASPGMYFAGISMNGSLNTLKIMVK